MTSSTEYFMALQDLYKRKVGVPFSVRSLDVLVPVTRMSVSIVAACTGDG